MTKPFARAVGSTTPPRTVERYARLTELRQRLVHAELRTHLAPTPAQRKAGNYPKGKLWVKGIQVSIENPRGTVRSGTSKGGKEWSVVLQNAYGYILGTVGKDKDHLDCFVGPHLNSDVVFVVDQVEPKTGSFDEHKVMLAWTNKDAAKAAYHANYSTGWQGFLAITPMTFGQFRQWLEHGDQTKPVWKQVTEKYQFPGMIERYTHAPKGGITSPVNGEEYKGGEFIPDHGAYCGRGKNRISKKTLETVNLDLEKNRISYNEENDDFEWHMLAKVGGEDHWRKVTSAKSFATLAKALGVKKEHYARHKPATGQGSLWKEEDHPRGQPDNAGRFAKSPAGNEPESPQSQPAEPFPEKAWQTSHDILTNMVDRPSLQRAIPYLLALWPEELENDHDPWGIRRAIEKGDTIPRVPTASLSMRVRKAVKDGILDAEGHLVEHGEATQPKPIGIPDPLTTPDPETGKLPHQMTKEELTRHPKDWQAGSNTTTPYEGKIPPVGSWRLDPHNGGLEQLQRVPLDQLSITESQDDVKHRDDYKQYVEWAKQGKQPPPITVIHNVHGQWNSLNRRRVMAAREAGHKDILAWVADTDMATGAAHPKWEDMKKKASESTAPVERYRKPWAEIKADHQAKHGISEDPHGGGPGQWTDEQERLHPRGKGDKGGQFVSKGDQGTETTPQANQPKQAASEQSNKPTPKPTGKTSLGGRKFDLLKTAKGLFFRIAPKAPWSKASPEATAAIERKDDEAAYKKAHADHQQAKWGDVPEARRQKKRAGGLVTRMVDAILQAMDAQAKQPDPKAAKQEAEYRKKINKHYVELFRQADENLRKMMQGEGEAKKIKEQIGTKLGRTPAAMQEVSDPETGELLPRHELETRQKAARVKAIEANRKQRQAEKDERRANWKKTTDRWEEARKIRDEIKAARKNNREAAKQVKENAAKAKADEKAAAIAKQAADEAEKKRLEAESNAKHQEANRKREQERQQAEQQKKEQKKQQEERGNEAVYKMAEEFGISPADVRKQANIFLPTFATSTGTNLTLPDWHDPRVIEKTRKSLEAKKAAGSKGNAAADQSSADSVRQRLDREEQENQEREAKRREVTPSRHDSEHVANLWDSAKAKLDAGETLEFGNHMREFKITPKNRHKIRFEDGKIEVINRNGDWEPVDDASMDTLGHATGLTKDEPDPWDTEEFARPGAVERYSARQK